MVFERKTVCFPRAGTTTVLQSGDRDFPRELQRLYPMAEGVALESLLELKKYLPTLSNNDFWSALTEGLSKIVGAEMTFVAKRMLVDEQNAAVEMPPIGEPGSCLMATALHFCDSNGERTTNKAFKYHAYACPCAYMRHDKVFLIPERLTDFITNSPNKIPLDSEAYLAVPLVADGKCFAHFGAMWCKDGAAKRQLSWSFMEMLMHSLEDMVLQRVLEGSNFLQPAPTVPKREKPQVIPHEVVTIAQSLRPYAGSLSHELRTPMQGVVGMLDIMYATVKECAETLADEQVRQVFEALKSNIEVVQDSSRRAVEAADNVVHAYDMDMSVPDAPAYIPHDDSFESAQTPPIGDRSDRPDILVAGSDLHISRPRKRRLEEAFSTNSSRKGSEGSSYKAPRLERASPPVPIVAPSEVEGLHETPYVPENSEHEATHMSDPLQTSVARSVETANTNSRMVAPGVRYTSLRDVIRWVIDEGLKVGGRPDSAIARETEHGEIIEVKSCGTDGCSGSKLIEWEVEPGVPETMFIDEKDLGKLISCVFLNAIKFTDHNNGKVLITARPSKSTSRGQYVVIRVADNGPGIPRDFLPRLFKAFSQNNSSITRSSDGLGLGLMVAKGIARKLGGDLVCSRAETEAPNRGTEFEIRVPLMAGDSISRPPSPFGSPMPRKASMASRPGTPPTSASYHAGTTNGEPRPHARPRAKTTIERLAQPPLSPTSPTLPNSTSAPETRFPESRSIRTELPLQRSSSSSSNSGPETVTNGWRRPQKTAAHPEIDRQLAAKYPLNFLVAEDNKINRKLLVSMLNKFGYRAIHEAHDGTEAVRQMAVPRPAHEQIDVVLMDLWMPFMDGFEATERILAMDRWSNSDVKVGGDADEPKTRASTRPTIIAVTADVTDGAVERAAKAGMKGFMSKPYKMHDLQRLITEYFAYSRLGGESAVSA